jgi:hypothetical protein
VKAVFTEALGEEVDVELVQAIGRGDESCEFSVTMRRKLRQRRVKIHVEVFVASRLLSRSRDTFTGQDLRVEIQRLFGDTRPGVDTHISAHCVANAPKNAGTVHNYIWRLDHSLFRLFQRATDIPHASRMNADHLPHVEDVPRQYRHLLPRAT